MRAKKPELGTWQKGQQVRYWSGLREGEGRIGKLSYDGVHDVSGTMCVYVSGKGAIALTHVEALPPEGTPQAPERVYVQHGSQPTGKWIEQSVNRPPAPWKEIGNLLDHWEQVNNDFKCQLQDDFPALYRAIEQLLITLESGDTVCMGCVSDGKEPHICPERGESGAGTLRHLAIEMGNAGYCNYDVCEKYLKKARNAALREAAEIARKLDHKGCVMLSECHAEIAAAIERMEE